MERPISLDHIAREPFRIFFPEGVLAGLVGVALWPLHFAGLVEFYPGQNHARIMAYGLFGGFIFGFLGTALPRMLSAKPLHAWQTIPLLLILVVMVASFAARKVLWGEIAFLALLISFALCMAVRMKSRKDTPPPGFVLVGMAFLSVTAGALLSIVQQYC